LPPQKSDIDRLGNPLAISRLLWPLYAAGRPQCRPSSSVEQPCSMTRQAKLVDPRFEKVGTDPANYFNIHMALSTCWIEVAVVGDTDGVLVITPRRRRR